MPAVTANLQGQGLRCLAVAAAAGGAELTGPDWQERSTSADAESTRGRGSAERAIDAASTSGNRGAGSSDGVFNVDYRRVVSERRAAAQGSLEGIIHIQNTFNNIILTLTDQQGFIKTYTSAGIVGFRGARRSQPVAAERAAEELARRALKLGYSTVSIRLKGPGNTKQYAVQSLAAAGLQIISLADVTPIPYNGCRLPKRRRRIPNFRDPSCTFSLVPDLRASVVSEQATRKKDEMVSRMRQQQQEQRGPELVPKSQRLEKQRQEEEARERQEQVAAGRLLPLAGAVDDELGGRGGGRLKRFVDEDELELVVVLKGHMCPPPVPITCLFSWTGLGAAYGMTLGEKEELFGDDDADEGPRFGGKGGKGAKKVEQAVDRQLGRQLLT
ncbi:hypothetical protein VOLCADRAFT_103256 [Volvox carteri f. nagariensis]|uniref:30S ribosomal protein S11 n=1 Tax=Volvox carteri f. nagariensis TaxID=3068 RepID=D8TKI9_VOLCA|nr:uncharacterized protein VOLCADRAFT_103256 [Volvox carteri f. nagariensis]EFJ52254.1 hypothetical protein VOLCADRAFT_103256 [Volvox carteri f. nagariensis]|eukprot:XP_002947028.1 hypothetical protein VOLCADRAFT_103256 [Volvox carteri f. nagariensis]